MAHLIANVLSILQLIVIGDALLSWFMGPEKFPRSLTNSITTPLYAPIRAVLSPQMTGGLDLSPIVMILLLRFMENMLAPKLF